jgi:AcrR family transcriptional regulator
MADSSDTRQKILDAALEVFARDGFDGASTRSIAQRANVTLALLHYHHGTKEQLYRAVWDAQYELAAQARGSRLADVDFSQPLPGLVRELVTAFVSPLLASVRHPKVRQFGILLGREATDPKEHERGMVEHFADPPARAFIAAFGRAMPELSAEDLLWGYQFMSGPPLVHVCDNGRMARLSKGAVRGDQTDDALPRLVEFIAGGWMALHARAVERSASRVVQPRTSSRTKAGLVKPGNARRAKRSA